MKNQRKNKKSSREVSASAGIAQLPEADLMLLYHELDVHRVELEMQNEELLQAKEEAEKTARRYQDLYDEYVRLYDFSPTGYITLTETGRIHTINFSAARILNKERSQLIKKTFNLFLSNDSLEDFENFFNSVFSKKDKQICEVYLKVNDKSVIAEITGIMTSQADLCLLTITDITARKTAEKEIIRAREEAESASRLKSAFLSTVSHELRTPLNSIIGFSGILLQEKAGALNEEQKKQLGMIKSSGRHLLALINDLLDFTKMESGKLSTYNEYFDLEEVIDEAVKSISHFVQEKSLELNFHKSDIGMVYSDKKLVHQVILNVLSNAVKFTSIGSVEVKCYREDHLVNVEITDTGIGIKKRDREKIFQPFVQVESSLTRTHPGSGLGLSVSKNIMEILGGKIAVKSKVGKGSTFIVSLPDK